jgi:aldose 1-epimerase
MSFEIIVKPIANFKEIIIHHARKGMQLSICTKGGLLNSWKLLNDNTNHEFIDGNDFTNGWGDFEMNGFKSGKMSPFSCRLQNGKYEHIEQEFTIEKFYLGAHALHGILYDALYEIESTTCNDLAATVTLKHEYLGSDKGYPFPYTVQLMWTINIENIISVQTIITNNSNQEIPMMDGWHPYFMLAANIEFNTLQFTNIGKIIYDKDLLPTGTIQKDEEFDHGKTLSGMHLDSCYILDPLNPFCILENTHFKLIVHPEINYPYLQIYTPDNRKSVAIENLSGVPNCFNNKMGLHYVKPHESFILKTNYQIIVK